MIPRSPRSTRVRSSAASDVYKRQAHRGSSHLRGAMIGVAGMIKVWPWAMVLVALPRGTPARRQVWMSTISVAVAAPLLAAIFGWSGLLGFFRNVFDAHQQHIVSDSVWNVPQMLFLNTGLARPVVHSLVLTVLLTAVLIAWVGTLLVVAI